MSPRIHLYPHAGSGNHGCEAIARTTAALLEGNDIRLYTFRPEEDRQAGLQEQGMSLVPVGVRPLSWKRVVSAFHSRILKDKLNYVEQAFPALYRQRFDDEDWCFSIGGDNYCYANMVEKMGRIDELLCQNGAKHFVLWGCSIEPELFQDQRLLEDLDRFSCLVPRESVTYEAMKAAGFGHKTILAPDPAFLLPAEERPFPAGIEEGNTVGINLSPLVMKRGHSPELVLGNYQRLIEEILAQTDMGILLIPHVMWSYEDDREPLKSLQRRFAHTGRVAMVEDGTAMELKGYIKRCRFFVGARTHSTIAAYSTGVPTLVTGYSVKARGIARDLFGSEQSFVLPVQELDRPEELSQAFFWITEHEKQIREQLAQATADYPARLRAAMGACLKRN